MAFFKKEAQALLLVQILQTIYLCPMFRNLYPHPLSPWLTASPMMHISFHNTQFINFRAEMQRKPVTLALFILSFRKPFFVWWFALFQWVAEIVQHTETTSNIIIEHESFPVSPTWFYWFIVDTMKCFNAAFHNKAGLGCSLIHAAVGLSWCHN